MKKIAVFLISICAFCGCDKLKALNSDANEPAQNDSPSLDANADNQQNEIANDDAQTQNSDNREKASAPSNTQNSADDVHISDPFKMQGSGKSGIVFCTTDVEQTKKFEGYFPSSTLAHRIGTILTDPDTGKQSISEFEFSRTKLNGEINTRFCGDPEHKPTQKVIVRCNLFPDFNTKLPDESILFTLDCANGGVQSDDTASAPQSADDAQPNDKLTDDMVNDASNGEQMQHIDEQTFKKMMENAQNEPPTEQDDQRTFEEMLNQARVQSQFDMAFGDREREEAAMLLDPVVYTCNLSMPNEAKSFMSIDTATQSIPEFLFTEAWAIDHFCNPKIQIERKSNEFDMHCFETAKKDKVIYISRHFTCPPPPQIDYQSPGSGKAGFVLCKTDSIHTLQEYAWELDNDFGFAIPGDVSFNRKLLMPQVKDFVCKNQSAKDRKLVVRCDLNQNPQTKSSDEKIYLKLNCAR